MSAAGNGDEALCRLEARQLQTDTARHVLLPVSPGAPMAYCSNRHPPSQHSAPDWRQAATQLRSSVAGNNHVIAGGAESAEVIENAALIAPLFAGSHRFAGGTLRRHPASATCKSREEHYTLEDYRILRLSSIVLRLLGWAVLVYGLLMFFLGLFGLEFGDGSTPALRLGFDTALRGLLLLVAGEAARLLLRMNERSQIQERRYRQLDAEREQALRQRAASET